MQSVWCGVPFRQAFLFVLCVSICLGRPVFADDLTDGQPEPSLNDGGAKPKSEPIGNRSGSSRDSIDDPTDDPGNSPSDPSSDGGTPSGSFFGRHWKWLCPVALVSTVMVVGGGGLYLWHQPMPLEPTLTNPPPKLVAPAPLNELQVRERVFSQMLGAKGELTMALTRPGETTSPSYEIFDKPGKQWLARAANGALGRPKKDSLTVTLRGIGFRQEEDGLRVLISVEDGSLESEKLYSARDLLSGNAHDIKFRDATKNFDDASTVIKALIRLRLNPETRQFEVLEGNGSLTIVASGVQLGSDSLVLGRLVTEPLK